MDDLSLDDLLSGLQQVQAKKTTAKLSERNVVELVNKLKQLGLLGDELLHTTNGKEYITREQIKVEVRQAVKDAGGRILLVDLPTLIGVDLVHCERAAEQLVSEAAAAAAAAGAAAGPAVFLAQGELFTPAYFDGLAGEVEEGLQEAGMVVLGEVARRFGLAADLVTSQLEARLGTLLQGKLEGGVIYTPAYLARIKAQLRGALRGALAPVSVPSLVRELGLEGLGSLQSLLPSLVEQLLAEGSIAGKLSGGSASWVPAVFVRSQQDAVKRFFQQNGYIGYDMVTKYGIPAPRAFLAQHFPDGIALDSAYVAPTVVDHVEGCIEEALAAGTWCDVQPVLPSILSPSDAAALLERCLPRAAAPAAAAAAGGGQPKALAKTCVVAPSFLESVRGVLLEEARSAAEEAHRRQKKAGGAQGNEGGKGTAAPSKQSAAAAQAADSDDDDDWDTGRGKGKKGKGGKKGKAAPAKAAGKQGKGGKQAQQAQQAHQADAAGGSMLSADSLAQRITQLHPDVDGAGASGELAAELASELRPAVVAEYERALHAIFTAGAERRRRMREAAGAALDEAHQRLQLYSHGAELFSEDEAASSVLSKHLLRSAAADCLDALLRYLAADLATDDELDLGQQGSSGSASGSGEAAGGAEGGAAAAGAGPLSAAQRAALVKQLGPDVKPAVSTSLEKLGGGSLEAFASEFSAAAEAAGLRLRKLDKKAEKALVAEAVKGWEAALAAEGEAGNLLLLLVPCLLAKHTGRAVSLPGRALGAAVDKLKSHLPEVQSAVLSDFHAAVVQQLRAQGGEGGGGGEEGGAGRVQELMGAAKQLVAAGRAGGEA